MEEALLHGACRYSGTKVTNRNKIAVGSGDFSFGEKNCVFLSAISGTISAKSLCFVFKGKVLRDWGKKYIFFSVTVSYRTSRLPFKAAAGAGGSIWGTPSVWESSGRWSSLYCGKQYFEVLYHPHVVCMTLQRSRSSSPLSLFGNWKGKLENPCDECTVI